MFDAPQSAHEIAPVVESLRRLDHQLDIRWEPKAVIERYGGYDADGNPIDPKYGGRWQIIRWNKAASLHENREYVLITTVTVPARIGKRQIMVMQENGPYAPVGEWLVEFMNTWDAAQRTFQAHMDAIAEENERHASVLRDHDSAATQEAAEKVYHKKAGPYWIGRGFGNGPRRSPAPTTH